VGGPAWVLLRQAAIDLDSWFARHRFGKEIGGAQFHRLAMVSPSLRPESSITESWPFPHAERSSGQQLEAVPGTAC